MEEGESGSADKGLQMTTKLPAQPRCVVEASAKNFREQKDACMNESFDVKLLSSCEIRPLQTRKY